MYRGFNIVDLNKESFDDEFDDLEAIGRTLCVQYAANAEQNLKNFVIGNGCILDGSAVQNHWFPTYINQFDIFISHSHNDESLAYALAGWIKENFDLNCFVDGEIWNSADGLIKRLDCLCQPGVKTYDYKKRNLSTSQIHAMLTIAIMQMIDNCECMFFLNTPESVPIKTGVNDKSLSPWIYLEIGISKIIEKKRNRDRLRCFSSTVVESSTVGFDLNTNHLTDLFKTDFCVWLDSYRNQQDAFDRDNTWSGEKSTLYPLDVLYGLFPIDKPIFE